MLTNWPGIELSQLGTLDFSFASTSDSADTGPTVDHTRDGDGKCYSGSGSLVGGNINYHARVWLYEGVSKKVCPRVLSRCAPQV